MPGPGLSLIVGPWARIRQAQRHAIFYPFNINSCLCLTKQSWRSSIPNHHKSRLGLICQYWIPTYICMLLRSNTYNNLNPFFDVFKALKTSGFIYSKIILILTPMLSPMLVELVAHSLLIDP